ncbi:MAG: HAD family hydrolase [Lachnospiraceae bacterium]|nr:HAD family hydrolase [Lachnospiraceae bacterium]
MIKLIVSDMDGCLLDGKGRLPEGFGYALELMNKNKVVFAAASGRAPGGMKRPFGQYADEPAFISDNGARAFYGGRCLYERALDIGIFKPVIAEMRRHEGLLSVACGKTKAWVERPDIINDDMAEELSKYYTSWNKCSFDLPAEPIIKFALLYFDDIEKNIYPSFIKYDNDRICIQVTAFVWMDVYEKGISKGNGIEGLQRELGIAPEETVVFGDYLNDLSMADHAAVSYAPANAHPDVKERYDEVIGSNTEGGVVKQIIRLLERKP